MIPINSSELLFNINVASPHKHILVVLLSIPAPWNKSVYIYILFQQEVVKLYTAYTRSQAVLVDKGLIEPICGLTPTFLSLVSPS